MKFIHIMLRIKDLDTSLKFYIDILGLKEASRRSNNRERFTVIELSTDQSQAPFLELMYHWEPENYKQGSNFGHITLETDNIYAFCQHLQSHNIPLIIPPRNGKTALICSPDYIDIQIMQSGEALELQEPWYDMPNQPRTLIQSK